MQGITLILNSFKVNRVTLWKMDFPNADVIEKDPQVLCSLVSRGGVTDLKVHSLIYLTAVLISIQSGCLSQNNHL